MIPYVDEQSLFCSPRSVSFTHPRPQNDLLFNNVAMLSIISLCSYSSCTWACFYAKDRMIYFWTQIRHSTTLSSLLKSDYITLYSILTMQHHIQALRVTCITLCINK